MKNPAPIFARAASRSASLSLSVSSGRSFAALLALSLALSLALLAAGCPASSHKTNVTSCQVDTECSGGVCIQSQCEPGDGDKDGDGLPNLVERGLGTDPARADTDGDGVDDLAELGGERAHPLDTDQDGTIDALESALLDSDHDCLVDSEDPQETSLTERLALAHCPSEGVCAGASEETFILTCEPAPDTGAMVLSCAVGSLDGYEAQETTCDQQDNDCDGQTDLGPDGQPMTCCQGDADCAGLAVKPTCLDATTCAGTETVATCDLQTHGCLTQTTAAPAACADEVCAEAACVGADADATFHAAGTCSAQGSCDSPAPESCDDEDACTTDTCDSSNGCQYAPVNCDDGDPCTTDTCDPASGCLNASLVCDQGPPCGEEGTCVAGSCVYPEMVCDDGNLCTDNLCVDGACQNPPLPCDDGNPCTVDGCDPVTGSCTTQPGDDGLPCDDGDACTQDDVCAGGQCAGVASVGAATLAPMDDTVGLVDAVHGLAPLTLPDNSPGYALAGEAWALNGSGDVPEQGWVGVVDADGGQRWGEALGGPGDDGLQGVAALPGGGFVAVGTYAAPGAQRDDLWVVSVAPTSDPAAPYDVQGRRLFDSGGDDAAFAVAPVHDALGDGFVVAGRAGGPNQGQTMKDGWLLRFDAQGHDVWRAFFGGPGDDELLAVTAGEDGLVYAAGTSSPGASPAPMAAGVQDADAWLVVVDDRGQLVRERRWDVGGGWDDEALAVVPLFSSATGAPRAEGVLLAGRTRDHSVSGTAAPQRAWAARLDAFGALSWDHFVPEGDTLTAETAFYGAAADAGGFVLVGAQGVAPYAVALDPLGNQRWARPIPAGGPLTSLAARPGDLGWMVGARTEADTQQLARVDAWGHGACDGDGGAGACATKTLSDCADTNPCVVPACEPYSDPGTGTLCTANTKPPAAPCPGADACHPVGACDDAGFCTQSARLFSWQGTEVLAPEVADLVPTRAGGYALFGSLGDGVNLRAHGWYLTPDGTLEGGNEPYAASDTWSSQVTAAARLYDGRLVVVGGEQGGASNGDAFIQWLEPDGAPIPALSMTYEGMDFVGAQWTDVAASADGRAVAAVGGQGESLSPPIFQTWDARGNRILQQPASLGTGGMVDTLTTLAPTSTAGASQGWVAVGQIAMQFEPPSARVVWLDLQGNVFGQVTFPDPVDPQMAWLVPRDVVALPHGRAVVVGERLPGTAAPPESFIAVVSGPGGVVSSLTILGAGAGNPTLEKVARGPLGLVAVGRAVVGSNQVVMGFALNPDVLTGASPVVRSWAWTPPGAEPTVLGSLDAEVLPGGDVVLAGTAGAPSQPLLARLDPWGNGAACDLAGACAIMDVRTCDGPVDGDPCTTSYCDTAVDGCLGAINQPDALCLGTSCSLAGACSDTGGCGQPVSCDDQDDCTLDACVEGVGCVHEPDSQWSQCCQAGLAQPLTAPDCDADGVADVCADAGGSDRPVAPGAWLSGDDLAPAFTDPSVEAGLAFADAISVAFVAHGEERGLEVRMAEPFGDGTDTWAPVLADGSSLDSVSVYQAWPAAAGEPADDGYFDVWMTGMGQRLELTYYPGEGLMGAFQLWDGEGWAYQDATAHVEVAGDRVRVTGYGAGPDPCSPFVVAVVVELLDASGGYHEVVKVLGQSDVGEVVTAYPYTQLIEP